MGRTVKIDERAFNRGVDEVMGLKPLKRVVSAALSKGKDKADKAKEGPVVKFERHPSKRG